MFNGKKVNPIFSSPTIKDGEYADPSICTYISYHCSYCTKSFPLVDHEDDYNAGGAILKQVLERDETGIPTKMGKVRGVCLSCSKAILSYQQSARS